MNTHTRTTIAASLAATLTAVATGCSAIGTESATGTAPTPPVISHIHDVAFDAGGDLLVGSHNGVYRIDLATNGMSLVGDTSFDAMGLTVQADTVLASGHPSPESGDTFTAPNVGLVRYTDPAWEEVSLAGITDFHMLATTPAAPDLLLGLPSDRAHLAVSTDAGETWADASPLTARDLSIDTMQPDIVTATTPDGLLVSRDAGATFSPLANAPRLLVIAAHPAIEEGIIGIDAAGTIWTGTSKPGDAWRTIGHATGVASAIAAGPDDTLAIVDEGGLQLSVDGGQTWQLITKTGA
jgi:hypothetical protein